MHIANEASWSIWRAVKIWLQFCQRRFCSTFICAIHRRRQDFARRISTQAMVYCAVFVSYCVTVARQFTFAITIGHQFDNTSAFPAMKTPRISHHATMHSYTLGTDTRFGIEHWKCWALWDSAIGSKARETNSSRGQDLWMSIVCVCVDRISYYLCTSLSIVSSNLFIE